MFNKYYTIDEANVILPDIREELVYLQNLQHELHMTCRCLNPLKRKKLEEEYKNKEDIFLLEAAVDFLEIQEFQLIRQWEKSGIYIRNIDDGYVDFPAVIDGSSVLLCWRQGEEFISYYHNVFDSYSKRKRIASANEKTEEDE
ncbi:DUF2203 domain-containing protein [Alteribacillus sp. HJP-4]|uniref:DUF2203 domain-containing protein n=1 Tax=Alteribacillus sp. HJP-4 TaxID=2775394 RepID=UPI0035CD21B3